MLGRVGIAVLAVALSLSSSCGGDKRVTGAGGAGGLGGAGGGAGPSTGTTVVLFLIDGLQPDAARTAADHGASNLRFMIDNGVVVETARSTSPAARTTAADGSLPWGNATSGNIAVHTGTHLYEAGPAGLDDIFQAARRAGIKSVFAGGDANYSGLVTADFRLAANVTDEMVVQTAISRLKSDKARLLRLHLQRSRDHWDGPAAKTDPSSPYIRHLVASDVLLGQLIQALRDEGVWDQTYLVVTADHGMGQTSASDHPPSSASSWEIFMAFIGPGLRKGATIPYAELPDVGVTATRFLGLPPLRGHTGAVDLVQRGPTGTLLTNVFVDSPADVPHPRYVDRYLQMNTFPSAGSLYSPYRTAMLGLMQ